MFPSRSSSGSGLFQRLARLPRGSLFGLILLVALIAFEIFNYSTTEFALRDVLGDLRFAGVRWATILGLAFCGIDFAGVARLFTPQTGAQEPAEVWYLFGAWLLAAAMNAILTWWGISVAIASHSMLSASVISPTTLTRVVPVFVAIMVWVIRILIIGTFATAGDRLLHGQARPRVAVPADPRPAARSGYESPRPAPSFRPAPKPARPDGSYARPEPTYHNVSMGAARPAAGQMSFSDRQPPEH